MIEIKKRSEQDNAETHICCDVCTDKADIYQIRFHNDNSSDCNINLCFSCMCELGDMIYDIYKSKTKEVIF